MACADLGTVYAELCGAANPPGVAEIYVIEHEYVTTIPAAGVGTHTITTDVTLTALKFWKKLPFAIGTGKMTIELQGEAPSFQSWMPMVECSVPKHRADVAAFVATMQGRPLHVAVKLSSGSVVLMTDADHAAYLKLANVDSGMTGTDKNQRQVQISPAINLNTEPYFYTGALDLS